MKTLLIIIVVVFAGAAGAMAFFQFQQQAKMEQQILDIKNRKDQVIKLDSLRDAIERKVFDSLSVEFDTRDKKIKTLENDLQKTRKDNAELHKLYNSIRVDMPQL
jgi:uncharacterized protein HemX